jgi:phosphatidylglycerol---prolipoprotein diacylglyceryl transferase
VWVVTVGVSASVIFWTQIFERMFMRRTLLLIPHEIASIPVFGFGWILGLMILAAIGLSVALKVQRQNVADYWKLNGFVWLVGALIVGLVMPNIELQSATGETVGMAIRGYGVMLLLGVVASVALALARARRYGIPDEIILGIAPWLLVGGIVGARTFYVIEYRDQFFTGNLFTTLRNIFNFTEGGLVVYGSFIGGFLSGVAYVLRNRLPFLRMGDVIVPCLFIGLALGRIGCLMNGCCYGNACENNWSALHFPNGSPVYMDQLASGELIGLTLDKNQTIVSAVAPESLADKEGIRAGDSVKQLSARRWIEEAKPDQPAEDAPIGLVGVIEGKEYAWAPSVLPQRANPVRPTQIMSSIGGLLLCLSLCWLSRFVYRDGVVMFVGFASYAVLRFVMEMLRNDEPGQFGTELTIAQWVSIVVFSLACFGLVWLRTYSLPHVQDHRVGAAGG